MLLAAKLLLVIVLTVASARKISLFVDTAHSGGDDTKLKRDLKTAYDRNMYSSHSHDDLTLFSFSNAGVARVMPPTNAREKQTIHAAIDALAFTPNTCANWCTALNHISVRKTDVAVLVVDENPCVTCQSNHLKAIAMQHARAGTKIMPIGVGHNVSNIWLKYGAAPCAHMGGCTMGWDYFHV